jgi:hypothetical protein
MFRFEVAEEKSGILDREAPHEEILCNERIKVVAELAPTFEQLLRTTIEAANRT